MSFSWKDYLADGEKSQDPKHQDPEQGALLQACRTLYQAGDSWFTPSPSHDGRISRLFLLREALIRAGKAADQSEEVHDALQDLETIINDVLDTSEEIVSKLTDTQVEST